MRGQREGRKRLVSYKWGEGTVREVREGKGDVREEYREGNGCDYC